MQLKDLKMGDQARITALNDGEKVYRQRLISLGLIPGTKLIMTRMAPLGDPIEISLRGYALSLRKHEASLIEIEKI